MISVEAYISKDLIYCGMAYDPLQERDGDSAWPAVGRRLLLGNKGAIALL
jgi:hypothetical protein